MTLSPVDVCGDWHMSIDSFGHQANQSFQPNNRELSGPENPEWEANHVGHLLKDGNPQFASELSRYSNELMNDKSMNTSVRMNQWGTFLTDLATIAPDDVKITSQNGQKQADIDSSSEVYVAHAIGALGQNTPNEQALSDLNTQIQRSVSDKDAVTFVADFNRRTAELALPYEADLTSNDNSGKQNIEIKPLAQTGDGLPSVERQARRVVYLTENGEPSSAEELSKYMNDLQSKYGQDKTQLDAKVGQFATTLNALDPVDFKIKNDGSGNGSFDFDQSSEIIVSHALANYTRSLKNSFLHLHNHKGDADTAIQSANEYVATNLSAQDSETFLADFNRRSAELGIHLEARSDKKGIPEIGSTK